MLTSIPELLTEFIETIRRLPAKEAYAECAQNGGICIDVREPSEVAESPVAGSINIPRGVLEMRMLAEYGNDKLPIYIHCATGARATLAVEQLNRLGYQQVTAISCSLVVLQDCCN